MGGRGTSLLRPVMGPTQEREGAQRKRGEAMIVPSPVPRRYLSAWPRARFALAGLALGVVGQLVSVAGDADRISVTSLELQGRAISHADISRSDQLFNLAGGFQLITMIVAAVLFLVWLHRIIRNGPALGGAELRFTPGWAVGWWFVPIANLVRPMQVLSEAWRTSTVEMPISTRDARKSAKLPNFLRLWWVMWLFFWFFTAMVALADNGSGVKALHDAATFDVALSLAYACAGLLCIVLVSRLTHKQARRREEVCASVPSIVQRPPPH
jgi:Domain of unknown function (DUF4328)